MVAKTAATRKAKGNRLEKKVAERYRYWNVDVNARRMPLSGAISYLKGDIHKPDDREWIDECKSHETVRLGTFWLQSAIQAPKIWQHPILHISANFRPIVTLIRECDYDDLVQAAAREDNRIDLTHKKRYSFWDEIGRMVQSVGPRATVVDIIVAGEALVAMDIDHYMNLRVAGLKAEGIYEFRKKVRKTIEKV